MEFLTLRSIIVRGVQYRELSITSLSEIEFESILTGHANSIAPDCHLVPFKCDVSDGREKRRADMAAIAKDYSRWGVIEVEMWGSKLYRHVLPQIEVFRDGRYGESHIGYLMRKMPTLDREALTDMLKGDQPEVVVMVNLHDEEWQNEIRAARCQLRVFAMYRSTFDEYAFMLDGPLLSSPPNFVSRLTCLPSGLSRFLKVGSPARLGIKVGDRITVSANGFLVELERYDVADACYLKAVGSNTLKPGAEYRLIQTGSSYNLESSER